MVNAPLCARVIGKVRDYLYSVEPLRSAVTIPSPGHVSVKSVNIVSQTPNILVLVKDPGINIYFYVSIVIILVDYECMYVSICLTITA